MQVFISLIYSFFCSTLFTGLFHIYERIMFVPLIVLLLCVIALNHCNAQLIEELSPGKQTSTHMRCCAIWKCEFNIKWNDWKMENNLIRKKRHTTKTWQASISCVYVCVFVFHPLQSNVKVQEKALRLFTTHFHRCWNTKLSRLRKSNCSSRLACVCWS